MVPFVSVRTRKTISTGVSEHSTQHMICCTVNSSTTLSATMISKRTHFRQGMLYMMLTMAFYNSCTSSSMQCELVKDQRSATRRVSGIEMTSNQIMLSPVKLCQVYDRTFLNGRGTGLPPRESQPSRARENQGRLCSFITFYYHPSYCESFTVLAIEDSPNIVIFLWTSRKDLKCSHLFFTCNP